MEDKANKSDQPVPPNECQDCDQSFKTAQGLAGHRRLAHSANSVRELERKRRELEEQRRSAEHRATELARTSEDIKRRETEVAKRQHEIAETGPRSIGLERCEECAAWFDTAEKLAAHEEAVHPLDEKVASEVGVSRERVNDVWTEACHKAERHPNESPDQIVTRFWSGTDQKILRALLAQDASLKIEEEA